MDTTQASSLLVFRKGCGVVQKGHEACSVGAAWPSERAEAVSKDPWRLAPPRNILNGCPFF